MLRVTIDIIPFGVEKDKKNLSTIEIINDGTANLTPTYGNYIINAVNEYGDILDPIYIKDFRRIHGFKKLVSMVLNKFDKIIMFDNFIENNIEAQSVNAFDLGKRFFEGLERGPMESLITPNKPKVDKIHCAIIYCSSTKVRDLSPAVFFDYIQNLQADRFKVTIIAPPEQAENVIEIAKEVAKVNPNLEMRKLVLIKLAITAVKADWDGFLT